MIFSNIQNKLFRMYIITSKTSFLERYYFQTSSLLLLKVQ